LREIASIRKSRGMNERVDAPECGSRRGNKLGCGPGIRQVASPPRDFSAGLLTVHGDRFQSLKPCLVLPLSMQHQAIIGSSQPARDRGSDPRAASGDD
jgi:hypothetical protein